MRVGRAGEATTAMGASVMGSRRFSTRMSASRTHLTTSSNWTWA
jgi:hypothetical protein